MNGRESLNQLCELGREKRVVGFKFVGPKYIWNHGVRTITKNHPDWIELYAMLSGQDLFLKQA